MEDVVRPTVGYLEAGSQFAFAALATEGMPYSPARRATLGDVEFVKK